MRISRGDSYAENMFIINDIFIALYRVSSYDHGEPVK